MTTNERRDLIGQKVSYKTKEGLLIHVTVMDHKVSYGRDRYLIMSNACGPEIWVENIYRKDDLSQI